MTGYFADSVDFNPGPGVDIHTATGHYSDAFLSAFSEYYSFQWAQTWGGDLNDEGVSVAADEWGNVGVTGSFRGEVQFDTGHGQEIYISNGVDDVFLGILDSYGNPKWISTWGGMGVDSGNSIAFGPFGEIYVAGFFSEKVDFDPTPGVAISYSRGMYDAFISMFRPGGLQ